MSARRRRQSRVSNWKIPLSDHCIQPVSQRARVSPFGSPSAHLSAPSLPACGSRDAAYPSHRACTRTTRRRPEFSSAPPRDAAREPRSERGASRLPVAHSRALCAPRCTCRDHGELLEHGAGEPVHVGPARQRALWPGTPAAAGQCFLRLYSARLRLHLLLRPHACLEFYMRGLALSPLASARDVKLVRAVSAAMLGPTRTLVPFADSFWTHTSSSPHLLPPPIVYSRPSQEATRPTASTRAPA